MVKFWKNQRTQIHLITSLNWITELVKASPTNYHLAEEILNLVSNAKNKLKKQKTRYKKI